MIKDNIKKSHWLIVDDDHDIMSIMSEYLEENGFNVLQCTDPRKIPELISKYHLSGVICDYVMPHMNGFEVHDLIRSHEKNLIPFILISGRADLGYNDRINEQKKTYFFSKPVDLEKVLNLVALHIKPNLMIDPEDYRSLEVGGMISIANDLTSTVPVILMDFSTDKMKFEVKTGSITTGKSYGINLSCDCQGESVSLQFSGKVLSVKHVDKSEVDEVTFSPIDLDLDRFNTIAKTYREKQISINDFLRAAKGIV